jgi:hypothetical protein
MAAKKRMNPKRMNPGVKPAHPRSAVGQTSPRAAE